MVLTTSTDMPLLALIYNRPVPQSVSIEHSGLDKRNSATVSNNVTNAYSNHNFRSYSELTYQKKFFLLKGRVLLKANSQQEIINIYPDKKDLIKNFIKENKTNFNDEKDVVALLTVLK